MKSGVYKITNQINGKCYIGSSVNLERRKNSHFSGKQTNVHLLHAMKKYGKENFTWEVLLECPKENLILEEQKFIDSERRDNLYNICPTAGSRLGAVTPIKTREILRKIKTGVHVHNEESRKKISLAGMGRIVSKETREKMSRSQTGHHHMSSENIQRLISINTGSKRTEEAKQKMSIAKLGTHFARGHKAWNKLDPKICENPNCQKEFIVHNSKIRFCCRKCWYEFKAIKFAVGRDALQRFDGLNLQKEI